MSAQTVSEALREIALFLIGGGGGYGPLCCELFRCAVVVTCAVVLWVVSLCYRLLRCVVICSVVLWVVPLCCGLFNCVVPLCCCCCLPTPLTINSGEADLPA